MRVSEQMRFQDLVPSYQDLMARQLRVQKQISSGKRIQQPSDDVDGTALAQSQRTDLNDLTQSLRNIDEGLAWSDTTFGVIDEAISVFQRINELVVKAGDATLSASDRTNMSQEVEQMLAELVSLGGKTLNGQTLIAGAQTDQPAFTAAKDAQGYIVSVAYNGDGVLRDAEIAPGRTAAYNMLGSNENGGDYGIFRDAPAGVDLFATLIGFRQFLAANDGASIQSISQPAVSAALNHLKLGAAKLGGIQNRMQTAMHYNQDQADTVSQSLSKIEDTDIASAAIESTALDTAYKAALATGARIHQDSLLDYLR